jgi:hypothetical protein
MREVLEVVIWPVTLLLVVLILRRPLADLVQSARRLKYKDIEMDFGRGIEEVQAEAREALPGPADPSRSSVEIDLYRLAQVSPTAAVLEAWEAVEASAKALLAARGLPVDFEAERRYRQTQDRLLGEEIIDARRGKIFSDLRQLRNRVAHAAGFTITTEQAETYVDLSIKLRQYLDGLKGPSA